MTRGELDDRTARASLGEGPEVRQRTSWNDTAAEYPLDKCVHELFEAQAHKSPEAVAVEHEGEAPLTYAALDAQANRLAHHLRALGVGPEVRVGVCVERSPEMMVGLLAILKAGGAYVPLDPAYPKERLAFMLRDARLSVVLTQARLQHKLPAHDAALVRLDADAPSWSALSLRPPQSGVGPDHAMYLIYTSGSTGRPKGVIGTHRGTVNRLAWMWTAYPFLASEVCCQKTTLGFVDSVWEIFGPLLQGVPVVVIPDAAVQDVSRFVRALAARRVTRVVLVPSLLRAMLDAHADLARELPYLKTWTTSGEVLPVDLCERFVRALPGRTLLNLYGSSEVAADATCFVPTANLWTDRVPIGGPIANTQVHVLDDRLEPVAIGASGELYVGGTGVARGYFDRPKLTAEKFTPDPFSKEPGARLFKTGDLGRWLSDGYLEYLGRADHQVKIRGFRVELGEIESVLREHPGVRACVVVAREEALLGKRLVAYVVPSEGEWTPSALREHLGKRLPEYMVPSVFVRLAALPLSPHGKVDRKALPAPHGGREATGTPCVAPRTPTEHALVGIWEQLLGVHPIGVTDNFFAVGGHSLLAARLLSAIKSKLGYAPAMASLFQAPTVETLARLADGTSERPEPSVDLRPLSRAQGAPAYAGLSGTERRLWFLERLYPEARSYQVPQAFRVKGPLDEAALVASLHALARRHELLRTTYPEVDGAPVRVVAEEASLPVRVEDVSSLPAPECDAAIGALLAVEIATAFDLERGPLTRALWVRLSDMEHIVLLHQHHIVTDEWSEGVLLREWSALYEAARRGRESPLAPLPFQYADYAYAEQQALRGDGFAASRAYWKAQLAGMPRLELPILRPSPGAGPGPEALLSFRVPEEAGHALRALCRESGCTLFMGWYAALMAVLSRYTGQRDIGLGTVIANREVAGTQALLGFFTNTVVLRTRFAGDPTFRELLSLSRSTSIEAYRHQALPFDVVVQDQGVERRPGDNPLYDVSLIEGNAPDGGAPGWAPWSGALPDAGTTAKNALSVTVQYGNEGTGVVLAYDTSRLGRAAAERLLGHLRTLVLDAVARPDKRLSELLLLTEPEREQLHLWNNTAAEYPADKCVHELFEAQAQKSPEAVAVEVEGERLTYAALDGEANRLAHHLRALGVGPEVRVGLCVERSLEMVVGLLAILKAGGAYVPFDPAYPKERLAFMLQDARVHVLLTQARIEPQLPAHGAPVVRLDAEASLGPALPPLPPERGVRPENLAYVLYTSGSTGKPKGIAMPHRALSNLLAWHGKSFSQTNPARTLQFASLSFDVSFQEILSTLTSGGQIALLMDEQRLDPSHLLSLLTAGEAERAFLPPAVLRHLGDAVRSSMPRTTGVRCEVIAAGEQLVLTPSILELFEIFSPLTLHNHYGPTETHVVSAFVCHGPPREGPVPIGRPIDNTRTYVLDRYLQPLPAGIPGELYLAGIQLARGYLDRPGLTAERFLPDPLSGELGARMYRTGDLARWNEQGELEFLGRTDHQVKIRGFRIELGEVESALTAHAAVQACAIMAREDAPGDKRLVAYVVPSGSECAPSALRDHILKVLPEYMVPSAFVMLEALPLTPNGKVDRKALSAPSGHRPELSNAYVAAGDATERQLVAMWCELLSVDTIGVYDNFFELGGHSLLAVQLLARIRKAFQVELPLRAMMDGATIRKLAERIAQCTSGAPRLPAIVPVPRRGDLPLTLAQQRLWFFEQLEGASDIYTMAAAWRLRGALDRAALRESLAEIVRRHENLRTTFSSIAGRPVQQVHAESPFELLFEQVEVLEGAPDPVQAIVDREAQKPFDLVQGPLFRATLVQAARQDHALVVVMHHIVSDGWSMDVFAKELSALYTAHVRQQPAALSRLELHYADYASWQQASLTGEVLESTLRTWKARLVGAPPRLDLPTDHPRPAEQSFRGAAHGFSLSREDSDALRALGRQADATLFHVLLTAYAVLLRRYSGQEDLLLGVPVANRPFQELLGLIGFLVNTLVLRIDVSPGVTFRHLISQVRDTALEAEEHQAVPLEALVEALGPERSLNHHPLFQVMFVWQGAPSAPLSLSGLVATPIEPRTTRARFDLTLAMGEESGRITGVWEYATDLFDADTIARMSDHFCALLKNVIAQPDQLVREVSILTRAERHRLLVEWNDTGVDHALDTCVHDLIDAQAARTPEAIALVFGKQEMTYGELNRRANQLASCLLRLGVEPEVTVALCIERSIEMIVAILGIWKAGGAYVPLDPSFPTERLAFMIEDAAPRVVITRETWRSRLPVHSAEIVCLDPGGSALSAESAATPQSGVGPDNLAYVIYTSGSTGRPKGVLLEHRGLTNFTRTEIRRFRFTAESRVLQFATLTFDASISEITTALCAGGRLVLTTPEEALPGPALGQLLLEGRITHAKLPPTALAVLPAEEYPALEVLMTLGEECSPSLIGHWSKGRRFCNGYGPTEFTIGVLSAECTDSVDAPPIGRPFDNTQAYVLDGDGQLVPIGVPGELYLGGVQLARGYLHQAALTAEKFVPPPPGVTTPRLYKTGDCVRYRADGNLDFIGRLDTMVKIRGMRIETGEIEAVLKQHSALRNAVVVVREERPGDRRLVAYVLPQSGLAPASTSAGDPPARPASSDLRGFIRRFLPEYMIPAAIMSLERFPLLSNGKIDRSALPPPSYEGEISFTPPSTSTEVAVAEMWRSLLEVERVGIHHNFFELGGHSLLATQLIFRLQRHFQLQLSVREVFQHPTLHELAGWIDAQLLAQAGDDLLTRLLDEM